MRRLLLAWVDETDIVAASLTTGDGPSKPSGGHGWGPIADALLTGRFDEAELLSHHSREQLDTLRAYLAAIPGVEVTIVPTPLRDWNDYREVYPAAAALCELAKSRAEACRMTFHLSGGTHAMTTTWVLLAKSRFRADLIESSLASPREYVGIRKVDVPFEIAADFLPDVLQPLDRQLSDRAAAVTPEHADFRAIICRSPSMMAVLERAKLVSTRRVPVILEGESGTGKELVARAIHSASRRPGKFVAVNCGAIPTDLVESELFGHERGAFTGATAQRRGHFVEADRGTLFLDEVGELPFAAQVKLLRALQEGEITPVGRSESVRVDVRVIAATNRVLIDEVAAENFREDLFYRLAVAVLRLPPLRERQGDVGMLIDHFLRQLNEQNRVEPAYKPKKLSASARNLLLSHPWPGNVRELWNTLQRIMVWSSAATVDAEQVRTSLLKPPGKKRTDVLDRALGDGFSLVELRDEVQRHYLRRAVDEAQGNKTKAAKLLGLPSYQRLDQMLKRFEVG